MATFQEKLTFGLLAMGWSNDLDSKVTKYAVFKHIGTQYRMFVGRMGALRKGVSISDSRSVGDPSQRTLEYNRVMRAGEIILQCKPTSSDFHLNDIIESPTDKPRYWRIFGMDHTQNVINCIAMDGKVTTFNLGHTHVSLVNDHLVTRLFDKAHNSTGVKDGEEPI